MALALAIDLEAKATVTGSTMQLQRGPPPPLAPPPPVASLTQAADSQRDSGCLCLASYGGSVETLQRHSVAVDDCVRGPAHSDGIGANSFPCAASDDTSSVP